MSANRISPTAKVHATSVAKYEIFVCVCAKYLISDLVLIGDCHIDMGDDSTWMKVELNANNNSRFDRMYIWISYFSFRITL